MIEDACLLEVSLCLSRHLLQQPHSINPHLCISLERLASEHPPPPPSPHSREREPQVEVIITGSEGVGV